MTELVEQVERAMFKSWLHGSPGRNGEAYARAAITEIFNWLEKPSEEATAIGAPFENELDAAQIWQAMLNQMRKEAGI